jgi:hypothetical protein
MGYTTEFKGTFTLNRPLRPEHAAYLSLFSETRRMRRDAGEAAALPDPVREAAGLPIGDQGGYFVGGSGFMGQGDDGSVTDHNREPRGQPGLWCQWVPTEDGKGIEWNGAEKFYYYEEWLKYLCEHFLEPWGYEVRGEVTYQGEDKSDKGKLVCSPMGGQHWISKTGPGRR